MSAAHSCGQEGPAAEQDDGRAALSGLLRRSAAGDEAAFAELYGIVAPRLYGMVLRLLGERAQAEEVTHEAFLVIWRTSARFDPAHGSAISWMLSIAHRHAVDRVRRAPRSQSRKDSWVRHQFEPITPDSTAQQASHASVEAAGVPAAVGSLRPAQRSAILLAYFDGQTHTEIAAYLGLPLGTAQSRLRDGLRALRQHTQEHDPEGVVIQPTS